MAMQRLSPFCFGAALGLAAILLCGSHASAVVVPLDLPADVTQYQLLFLTHDTTQAISTDINCYNNFVAQEAALSDSLPSGLDWRVIGSTSTVNAKDNVPVPVSDNVPIYTPSGVLIANSEAALWQAASTPLLNQLMEDQYGDTWVMDAWTGTKGDGTAASGQALGQWSSAGNGVNGPVIGCGVFQNSSWLDVEAYSNSRGSKKQALSLYGLSSVVTVPDPVLVPEPLALVLLATGMLALLACVWRRRRQST